MRPRRKPVLVVARCLFSQVGIRPKSYLQAHLRDRVVRVSLLMRIESFTEWK